MSRTRTMFGAGFEYQLSQADIVMEEVLGLTLALFSFYFSHRGTWVKYLWVSCSIDEMWCWCLTYDIAPLCGNPWKKEGMYNLGQKRTHNHN